MRFRKASVRVPPVQDVGSHCSYAISCAATSDPTDAAWDLSRCQTELSGGGGVEGGDGGAAATQSVLCRCVGVVAVAVHVQWFERLLPGT